MTDVCLICVPRQNRTRRGQWLKKGARQRELIDTGHDKRFVRRDEKGSFDQLADVGRSLSQDVRKHAKNKVRSSYLPAPTKSLCRFNGLRLFTPARRRRGPLERARPRHLNRHRGDLQRRQIILR